MSAQTPSQPHDEACLTGHPPDGAHAHPHAHGSTASPVLVELRAHLPFSVSAVTIGLIVAGTICILGASRSELESAGATASEAHAVHEHGEHEPEASDGDHAGHEHGPAFARLFFHLFHPAHMLFSAAATAAMFCRYERRWLKAIVVGLVGAIGVCGISDIAMPHVSLMILRIAAPWHICVIEHPELVLPFAAVGVLIGIGSAHRGLQSTIFSHSLHVLASTMATIFYMVGPMGTVAWIDKLGEVFVMVVLAVMVPCCMSDIVFPTLLSGAGRQRYAQEPHVH